MSHLFSSNLQIRPALADSAKIGFFSLDRASQTEVTEIVDLKEMTEVLQILLQVHVNDYSFNFNNLLSICIMHMNFTIT